MDSIDLSIKDLEALKHIRSMMLQRGKMPSVRELMAAMGYRSPRSADLLIKSLMKKGFLNRRANGSLQLLFTEVPVPQLNAQTVNVPLVGTVSCGIPLASEENMEALIPVSIELARPPHQYFLLRAKGDSMNEKGIDPGDLVLIRQQTTANNGDVVVALVDGEATIKEFQQHHHMIVLKPCSSNKKHQPIILTDEFKIQGLVVTTIPNNLVN